MLKSLGTNMDHSDSDESSSTDSDSEVEIDEIVNKAIIDFFENDFTTSELSRIFKNYQKRKRYRTPRYDLWNTPWGIIMLNPLTSVEGSTEFLLFQRRFRCPYPLFRNFLVNLCNEARIFKHSMNIPTEFKLLVSLRVLATGESADSIQQKSFIPQSSINIFFKEFVNNFPVAYKERFVYFPTGKELKEVMVQYENMGVCLACGSVDVTHVHLGMCPESFKIHCTGKEGFPTLAFQVICGPKRRIFHCSDGYYGSYNDKTICHNDPMCKQIKNGLLAKVEAVLFDEDNVPVKVQGGFIISDGGYLDVSWLIDPCTDSYVYKNKIWSEWLESIRKDVECVFGIIKKRFRFFLNPIQYRSFELISSAFQTCCILHNILLQYKDVYEDFNWERENPVEKRDFDSTVEHENDELADIADTVIGFEDDANITFDYNTFLRSLKSLAYSIQKSPFGFSTSQRSYMWI